MFKAISAIFFSFILIATIAGCTKEPGVGGTAQIVGRVRTIIYDSDQDSVANGYPIGQRVYIIYGNDTIFNNDTRTNENGYYRFKYLNVGKYTLYTESYCAQCQLKKDVVKTTVTVAQPKQAVSAKELVVKKLQ